MLIDATELPAGQVLRADLCVIGAGAAGITIARDMVGSGYDVLLCEGGGIEPTAESTGLYRGEVTGRPFGPEGAGELTDNRQRYFGGSTNRWGGFCLPLDPVDFERRPWLPHSGWPIEREALDPYYERAVGVLGLAGPRFDWPYWEREHDAGTSPIGPGRLSTVAGQIWPQRFGDVYREELVSSDDVTVVLNANATRVNVAPESDLVTSISLATVGGVAFSVEATAFVLAMGGIENPRLLLASDDVRTAGVGNGHDLVGRLFTEHLQTLAGFALLRGAPDQHPALQITPVEAGEHQVALSLVAQLSAEVLREEELVGAGGRILPEAFPAGSVRQREGITGADVADLARSVTGRAVGTSASLLVASEQQLDPDSRVTLGDDVDGVGVPRVRVHWKQAEVERRSMLRFCEVLGQELGRTGLGRVQLVAGGLTPTFSSSQSPAASGYQLDPDAVGGDFDVLPGNHHMCTTRMASSASSGVVDADGRVFDTANLYVAGSSVFATGGVAPPTFTIVALALRLAERLRTVLAA
jgi:choline dehydrogenase-like flavoprotein